MMPFSGVRNSCDMLVRKTDLSLDPSKASSRDRASSTWARSPSRFAFSSRDWVGTASALATNGTSTTAQTSEAIAITAFATPAAPYAGYQIVTTSSTSVVPQETMNTLNIQKIERNGRSRRLMMKPINNSAIE